MLSIKRVAVLISIMLIGLNYECLSASSYLTKEPYKILFIGSSYFNYNDLPTLFENLVEASGNEIYIDR